MQKGGRVVTKDYCGAYYQAERLAAAKLNAPVVTQQQQQQLSYANDQDSYEEQYNDQYDDASYEDDYNQQQVMQHQSTESSSAAGELTEQQLVQEADVHFDEILHTGVKTFKPRHFSGKHNGEIKNEGHLIFAVNPSGKHKPSLEIFSGSNEDDYGSHTKPGRHDLVKEIALTLTTDYPGSLVISFPTVAPIGKQFYGKGVKHVRALIPAGVIEPNKAYTKVMLERRINNAQLLYNNKYPIASEHSSVEAGILFTRHDEAIFSLKHQLVYFYNKDHPMDPIDAPSPGFETTNEVKLPRKLAEKYNAMAQQTIPSKISLGDVTHNMQIAIAPHCPNGFANIEYPLSFMPREAGMTRKQQQEKYLDTDYTFTLSSTTKYIKLDKEIELNFNL